MTINGRTCCARRARTSSRSGGCLLMFATPRFRLYDGNQAGGDPVSRAGAKAHISSCLFSARLKSCPDTKQLSTVARARQLGHDSLSPEFIRRRPACVTLAQVAPELPDAKDAQRNRDLKADSGQNGSHPILLPRTCLGRRHYSGFDSALYRRLAAKWHFSQENAASHDLEMATCESKPL
jgi:hypothetical protein